MSPGRWSRSLCSLSFVALVACTKANPDACCENDAQCIALGVPADEHRACENGQTCSPVTLACVAPECTANTDCDPTTPVCSNRVCIAACHTSDDCTADAATPLCQTETGTCVGCLDASTCGGDTPYCDADAHACRGCARDAECPSGVCIEADAVCATVSSIVAVSSVGMDTGECSLSAPCGSLTYALQKVSSSRNVVRVTGGQLINETSTVSVDKDVVFDSDGTRLYAPSASPLLSVAANRQVTVEGLAFTGNLSKVIVVATGAQLRFVRSSLERGSLETEGGSIDVRDARFAGASLGCTGGALTVHHSRFEDSGLWSSSCQHEILGNRWEPVIGASIGITGGSLRMVNNVFVVPSEFIDLIRVFDLSSASMIAFNTIVNTSSVRQSPVAITCNTAVKVTSNIVAYNSPDPIAGYCDVRNTLFDAIGAPDAAGNITGDVNTFFQDLAAGDFHLAVNSPARELGEAGIVGEDLEGSRRPLPASRQPDAGAYEAR